MREVYVWYVYDHHPRRRSYTIHCVQSKIICAIQTAWHNICALHSVSARAVMIGYVFSSSAIAEFRDEHCMTALASSPGSSRFSNAACNTGKSEEPGDEAMTAVHQQRAGTSWKTSEKMTQIGTALFYCLKMTSQKCSVKPMPAWPLQNNAQA